MKFELLTPACYRKYAPYFKGQQYELCEYCLPTMTVWSNEEYRPSITIDNNYVLIGAEFRNKQELNHLLLPIASDKEYTPEELYKLACRLGYPAYWFVPQSYVEGNRVGLDNWFIVNEQVAYEDYIYSTDDLASLSGNRYAKKRNLINQFRRQYDDERIAFEPVSTDNTLACLDFLEEWCSTRECDEDINDSLTCERMAAEKMLQHIELFDSRGLIIRLDGKISGFAVASRLTPRMGVLQFEKAFEHIKGLYQYFDQQCIQRLFKGLDYVNKESDMEVAGLKKSKLSYYPLRRIKSYQLILKS